MEGKEKNVRSFGLEARVVPVHSHLHSDRKINIWNIGATLIVQQVALTTHPSDAQGWVYQAPIAPGKTFRALFSNYGYRKIETLHCLGDQPPLILLVLS